MMMKPGILFRILVISTLLFGNEVINCKSPSPSSLSTSNVHHLCISEEKAALLEFKRSFVAPLYNMCGSDTDSKLDSWKEEVHTGSNNTSGGDCCSWEGVECDVSTGHVIGLDLHCGQLYGTIPSNSTLFHLSHLRKLNLAHNEFNGSSISPAFSRNFPHLTHLNLSDSEFSGLIPPEIAHLSLLISLSIYSSHRHELILEPIAFEMLIKNLTQLETLFFDRVTISSPIPEGIGNLSSLSDIQLSQCQLYGEIPQKMFDLPKLRSLNLARNGVDLDGNGGLVGYLPKSNWNCSSSLSWLQLSAVRFSSEFPDLACCLKSLSFLDLSDGGFFGSIPPWLGNLSELISLDLSYNNFTGQVPVTLSNLSNLESLALRYNSFEGEIPDSFARLTKLRTLDFPRNNFNGKFPQWLANLTELENLSLQGNKLTGHIPSNISELQNLYQLDLSNNSIGGAIPSGLFALPLYDLYLSSNQFSGTIPSNLTDNERLQTIDLRNNKLSGTIEPLSFVNLKSLTHLLLSHNSLQGPLPLIPLSLSVLSISNNKFQGDIPPSICSSMLRVLDLYHNNLSGMIPKCISNFSYDLSVLNLGMNGLSGTIPLNFAEDNQLRSINLNGNHLEGQVPRSLANCMDLEVLDLGKNKIIDTFPYWLESLPELQVLVLRHNKFHGMLGLSRINNVTSFPKLRILDLSHNEFIGPLPANYFPSLNAMKNASPVIPAGFWQYMDVDFYYDDTLVITLKGVDIEVQRILVDFAIIDLSSNRFQGQIPDDIGSLLGIRSLNLSSNALTGNIPSSLAHLRVLESLDLSSNQLSGVIPQELTHITFLQLLNLSSNHLTGPIPRGSQFDTFQNDSYSGNWGLCGPPLSKGCSHNGAPHDQPSLEEDDDEEGIFDGFGWKIVLLGYGCGTVFGLGVGFVMFSTGKPKRLMTFVEEVLLRMTKQTGKRRAQGNSKCIKALQK